MGMVSILEKTMEGVNADVDTYQTGEWLLCTHLPTCEFAQYDGNACGITFLQPFIRQRGTTVPTTGIGSTRIGALSAFAPCRSCSNTTAGRGSDRSHRARSALRR